MSDLELLFLVLIGLYAWECSIWLRRGSVGFVTWLGQRWRVVQPGALIGNQRGGFVFAPPLPPLGTVLSGSLFPISFSPEAALAFVSASVNPGGRPPQTGKLTRFDQIKNVTASGKKVLVNNELFLKAGSTTLAHWLAEQLRQLSRVEAAKRGSAIDEMIRGRFDVRAIEVLWQEFQKRTAVIEMLANCVFVHLFCLSPLALRHWGLRRSWIVLLIVLLALTSATAFLFWRVHKCFYPEAEEERFTHFLTILLAPATTIRANDVLSKPLLERFHPLAIAKVFCPEQVFQELARQNFREVCHPALPVCPDGGPEVQAVERHGRELLRKAMERFMTKHGLSAESLVAPPAPTDESCRTYCPRCLAQFTFSSGVCADCGGIELASFGASALETKRSTE